MERDSRSVDWVLYSFKRSLNTSDIEPAINQFSYLVLHQLTKRRSPIWSITEEERNADASWPDHDQVIPWAGNDLKAVSNYHERLKPFFSFFCIKGDERRFRLDGIGAVIWCSKHVERSHPSRDALKQRQKQLANSLGYFFCLCIYNFIYLFYFRTTEFRFTVLARYCSCQITSAFIVVWCCSRRR